MFRSWISTRIATRTTSLAMWSCIALAWSCGSQQDSEKKDGGQDEPSQEASPEASKSSTQPSEDAENGEDSSGEPSEPSPETPKPSGSDGAQTPEPEDSENPKEEDTPEESPKKPQPMPTNKAELCQALKDGAQAQVSGKEVVDWWESFVDTFPGRQFKGKKNGVAAEYLRGELETLGYETEILELEYRGRTVKVVQGLMQGEEKPGEYTVIGAHYDHVSATPSGAYDNASGVATVMSICTQLSKAELRRSHVCLFFDAEENGLWGSAAWVQKFVKQKTEDIKVVQMYGFDMAGINWPGKTQWPLHGTVGLPKSMRSKLMEPHATTIETVLLECVGDEIGMKKEGLKVLRVYDKSSDEISFMHGGVPIIRFFGGRQASDYPYYHRAGDTKEGVYKVAGGRENFEMGIEMAIKSSFYTIRAFDLLEPHEAKVLQ